MVAPAVVLAVLLIVLPGVLYVWAGLPSTSNLSTARLPLSTRIYDRTGSILLAEIHQGSERRHIVRLSQVAPAMRQATIAVEDRTFYQHGGLNLYAPDRPGSRTCSTCASTRAGARSPSSWSRTSICPVIDRSCASSTRRSSPLRSSTSTRKHRSSRHT